MELSKKGQSKKKAKHRRKAAQMDAFERLSASMQSKVVAGMKVAAERIAREKAP